MLENSIKNTYGFFTIKRTLEYMKKKQLDSFSKDKLRREFIRNMLPYNISKQGDKYILLNREYKPLGAWGYSNFVDYNNYEALMIDDNRGIDYFYGDITNPNNSKFCFDTYIRNLEYFLDNKQDSYIKTIKDDKIRTKEFSRVAGAMVGFVKEEYFTFIR